MLLLKFKLDGRVIRQEKEKRNNDAKDNKNDLFKIGKIRFSKFFKFL
jgi:hypothetical protein